jgi:hypothetical protein
MVATKQEMNEKERVIAFLTSKVNKLQTKMHDLELEKKQKIHMRSEKSLVATKEEIHEKERVTAFLTSKMNELQTNMHDLELEKKQEISLRGE